MSKKEKIKLTPEELEAEKQDRRLLALVLTLNPTNPVPLDRLLDDAHPVSELEYWAYKIMPSTVLLIAIHRFIL